MTDKIFLRRKSAADVASVSLPVLDRLIREGRIQVVRVGRAVLILRESIEAFASAAACEKSPASESDRHTAPNFGKASQLGQTAITEIAND